jgi:predicted nucleotidyltransferase
MTDAWRALTEHQATKARVYLAERRGEREHLVVYLSGAHAYGFPSPDSDLDLKCVHIAPTRELVGLNPPDDPPGRIDIVEGVELDYSSNELAAVLRGCIKGNGNYLERILGELALDGDMPLLARARRVVAPLLSRRVGKHYAGFATSQLRLFDEKPTAKRALYVLRTAATGRCLLARGVMLTDVAELMDFVPHEIDELLAIKKRGEKQALDPVQAREWRARLTRAIDAVDSAWPTSVLPPEPPESAIAALDGWLQDVRKAHW